MDRSRSDSTVAPIGLCIAAQIAKSAVEARVYTRPYRLAPRGMDRVPQRGTRSDCYLRVTSTDRVVEARSTAAPVRFAITTVTVLAAETYPDSVTPAALTASEIPLT